MIKDADEGDEGGEEGWKPMEEVDGEGRLMEADGRLMTKLMGDWKGEADGGD